MITDKMTDGFRHAEGGLFSAVEKADVGDGALKLKEKNIALMSWADPFYPYPIMPDHVAKAIVDSVRSGMAEHYTVPIGSLETKKEIAKKLKRVNGLDVVPGRNILITPGSDSALFYAMLPFIDKGDEVMIVDPSYPNNFQNVEILGGRIVRVPIYAENGYQFEIEEFEKRYTANTKMVVLTNPNNPTTTVFRRDRLERLAEFIIEKDLVLVVDQAFEQPVFDGVEMVTMAALPGMWERTVTVCSLSKGLGLSGLRVGYIVADDRIMDKYYSAAVSVLGATNTAAQAGATAALRDESFAKPLWESFERRRRIVYDHLHDIPGVSMLLSESGFLSWVDVSNLGDDAEIAAYLVENARVSINAGRNYGRLGEGHLRIVHGVFNSDAELAAAMQRMRTALIEYGERKNNQR